MRIVSRSREFGVITIKLRIDEHDRGLQHDLEQMALLRERRRMSCLMSMMAVLRKLWSLRFHLTEARLVHKVAKPRQHLQPIGHKLSVTLQARYAWNQ